MSLEGWMERGARGQGFVRGVREVPTWSDVQEAVSQVCGGWGGGGRHRLEKILSTLGVVKCIGMSLQPQESH